MSRPRRVLRGTTYLITRRCYQRTFRLRPSPRTNAIFGYCLALALHKTGVVLHAVCVMSNHHHLVVTDPYGRLPEFLRELHRSTAKALNAAQGQWENLWAAEPCNAVVLASDADIVDKIAYVVANPVAAGIVASPKEWPGLLQYGAAKTRLERPDVYFDAGGGSPDALTLDTVTPTLRENWSTPEEWPGHVATAIRRLVAEAHRRARTLGRGFGNARDALTTSFLRRATTYEEKRGITPRIAAKDGLLRRALRDAECGFQVAYRAALEAWQSGLRSVSFPDGTWWMRVHHGCATPG